MTQLILLTSVPKTSRALQFTDWKLYLVHLAEPTRTRDLRHARKTHKVLKFFFIFLFFEKKIQTQTADPLPLCFPSSSFSQSPLGRPSPLLWVNNHRADTGNASHVPTLYGCQETADFNIEGWNGELTVFTIFMAGVPSLRYNQRYVFISSYFTRWRRRRPVPQAQHMPSPSVDPGDNTLTTHISCLGDLLR